MWVPSQERQSGRTKLATTPRNTTLARGAALRAFASWLRHAHGLELAIPVPAAVLLDFVNQAADGFPPGVEDGMIGDSAKRPGRWSVATVEARVRHLSKAHKLAGLDSPAADVRRRERIAAMKRAAAQAGTTRNRHEAITLSVLEQLIDTCDRDTLTGLRDRAVMLFAWASGGIPAGRMWLVTGELNRLPIYQPSSHGTQSGQGR